MNTTSLRLGKAEIASIAITATVLFLYVWPGFLRDRFPKELENASAAKARNLAIASWEYANDHAGTYPSGETSTAIFQQLYDGRYLTEPADAFLTTYGAKSIAQVSPQLIGGPKVQLSAVNVSYDYVTRSNSGLKGSDDPVDLPLLYSCSASEPTWAAGSNEVTLDFQCPWVTEGVTLTTLGQFCRFKKADASGHVSLTEPTFRPTKNVTYVSKKP